MLWISFIMNCLILLKSLKLRISSSASNSSFNKLLSTPYFNQDCSSEMAVISHGLVLLMLKFRSLYKYEQHFFHPINYHTIYCQVVIKLALSLYLALCSSNNNSLIRGLNILTTVILPKIVKYIYIQLLVTFL